MDYTKVLKGILDLGEAMINSFGSPAVLCEPGGNRAVSEDVG